MLVKSFYTTFALLLLIVMLVGCDDGGQPPVTGKVTLDGDPLPEATVAFIPIGRVDTNSVATTDENGEFSLNYTSQEKGATPGRYQVQISKIRMTDAAEIETLPAKYNAESDLEVEVTEDGENRFEFDLEAK